MPDGAAYMVMEYLRGESLTRRFDRLDAAGQRMTLVEALQLGAQLADALTAAHEKGIVHRDMKPGNVMLVRDSAVPGGERAKILDFGIAKLSDHRSRTTDTNLVIGTPPYMSPEQCRGAGGVDEKTDVYALGIMLYEMFAGRPPFLAGEGAELLAQHMFKAPPPLLELAPHVPADVAELVHRLLVKDKAGRPTMSETGAELARQLSRLSGIVLIASRPLAELSGAHAAASSGPGNSPTTLGRSLGETRRSGQRARWRWMMLAGAWTLFCLGGLGVAAHYWLWPSEPGQQVAAPAVPVAPKAPPVRTEVKPPAASAPPVWLPLAAATDPLPKAKPARAGGKKHATPKVQAASVPATAVPDKPAPAAPPTRPRVRFED